MLSELGNDLKNILLAGVGAVAFTAEKSTELVKELVKKGELTVEQGKTLTEELKRKYHESVQEKNMDAASDLDVEHMTREERDALRRRLEALEAQEMQKTADAGEAADAVEPEEDLKF